MFVQIHSNILVNNAYFFIDSTVFYPQILRKSQKYNVYKLVYYEVFEGIVEAIAREKQIKGWVRSKKIALIEGFNPEWKDLYESIV